MSASVAPDPLAKSTEHAMETAHKARGGYEHGMILVCLPGRHHDVSHLDYILGHHVTRYLRVGHRGGGHGTRRRQSKMKNAEQSRERRESGCSFVTICSSVVYSPDLTRNRHDEDASANRAHRVLT